MPSDRKRISEERAAAPGASAGDLHLTVPGVHRRNLDASLYASWQARTAAASMPAATS